MFLMFMHIHLFYNILSDSKINAIVTALSIWQRPDQYYLEKNPPTGTIEDNSADDEICQEDFFARHL